MVVRITYPLNSLTWEEQQEAQPNGVRLLYFYGDMPDYDERMKKAWRPGATAEVFNYTCLEGAGIIADRIRGAWLPFDAKLSKPESEKASKRERQKGNRLY